MNTENVLELDLKSLAGTAAQKHKLGELEEAESIYRKVLSTQSNPVRVPDALENLYHLVLLDFGTVLEKQGKLDEAVELYQQALRVQPDFIQAHFYLANTFTKQGKLDEAVELYQQALRIQPDFIQAHFYLANTFTKQDKFDQAVESYQKVLKLQPDFTQAHFFLANAFKKQGKLDLAVESCQKVLKLKPDFTQAHFFLANLLKQQGKFQQSFESYQQVLKLKPDFAEAYNNLGNLLKQQGKLQEAVESYQQVLKLKPNFAEAYKNLGNLFKEQDNLEKATQYYQKALELKPDFLEGYVSLGSAFRKQGKLKEAVHLYLKAFQKNPDFAQAELGVCISQLSIIYTSVEEIKLRREQYQNCLQNFANRYQDATLKQQANAAIAVGSLQPFFLAYQGLNDRPLQAIYGQLMHQLMSSRYPQFSQPISDLKIADSEKIRVGFVSGFFRGHSNWKIPIKGWVENLDHEKFELFGYHTNLKQDQYTEEAKQAFVKLVQGPLTLEQWCETIQQDRLHILIFPEFGMDPVTLQLGCLRLAPIQMTSWGHPQTSGLPTIDYYLSSDLMEPENAQEHYTEKLVRLPNLSIHYTPLEITAQTRSKAEIGLKEDDIMFWCCQSLYKYLPQHDDVFPRIAQQLQNCKFVFIKYMNDASEGVTEVFTQRLSRAFEEYGLNYQDYCIFLPQLKSSLFASTTALADVFLDSMGWSGCNSSLEAITYDIPIVTLAGELMRGRHTLALLKMMGIEETIALNKENYIQIAIRLGQDAQYRQHISQKVAENKHKLYGDLETIKGLENLLVNVVRNKDSLSNLIR